MAERITATFKLYVETEEPAELVRLLNSKSFESLLLADVTDAIKGRLAGEGIHCQLVKIQLKAPHFNGGLNQ